MTTRCSILAWRIPWTEECGGPHSIVSQSRTPLECLSMHAPYFYFSDILERTEQKEMDFVRSSLDIWETFASHSWACVLYCLFHILLLRSFSWQEGHPLTSNPTYLLARIQSKCLSVNPITQAFLVISLFPTQ